MKIGFIGVGSIGTPMAKRLRGAGHELVVMDANRRTAQEFVRDGGTVVDSPRAVASVVETIFYSLPTPGVVRSVTLGEDGVVFGQMARVVIDLSTTGPSAAIEIGKEASKYGKQMFDAPVSGGVAGAAKGTLSIMAAGPRRVFDEIRPLLEVIGRVFFVGESIGHGHTMKLLNNILSATAIAATTEVMVLGVKAGLDSGVMIDVLNASSGQNTATKDKYPRSILNRTFNYGFRTDLLLKDVRLCRTFAQEIGVPLRVGNAVIQTWELAEREFEHEDYTNLVKVLEREAGVVIGSPMPAVDRDKQQKGA